MKIEIIPCLNDNYSYLIHDEISNKVAIVDADIPVAHNFFRSSIFPVLDQ